MSTSQLVKSMKPPVLRTPFNFDRSINSLASALDCPEGSSKTNQADATAADINNIVAAVLQGATLPIAPPPTFSDFTAVGTFHDAQNVLRAATESFMALPAATRAKFDNDPGEFVAFCESPENLPEMRKMGLALPEEPAPAPPVAAA